MRTFCQILDCPPAWRLNTVPRIPWDVNDVTTYCENNRIIDFSVYTRSIYPAFGE